MDGTLHWEHMGVEAILDLSVKCGIGSMIQSLPTVKLSSR